MGGVDVLDVEEVYLLEGKSPDLDFAGGQGRIRGQIEPTVVTARRRGWASWLWTYIK